MTTKDLVAVLTGLDPVGTLSVRIRGHGDFDGHEDIASVTDKEFIIYGHDSDWNLVTVDHKLGYLLIEHE